MQIVHVRPFFLFKGLFLLFILCALTDFEVKAAPTAIIEGVKVPALTYDEFPVCVIVEGSNSFFVDALFANNGLLYVNIDHLFQTLGIPCIAGQNGDLLNGFIENESRTYSIDYNAGEIKVGAKTINAKNGLIKDMGSLYVESSLFDEAFGIILTFNFRALTIILKSDFELPFIKQLRIEKMRSNISKLKGEIGADTIVRRNYHLLKLGTMDWSVASSQTGYGSTVNTGNETVVNTPKGSIFNNFRLGIGTELLFGEANVSVNYSNQYKFDSRQLQYLWRWVDNTKSIIKQAQLGKISNQTISFIKAPVLSGIVRNSPTSVRKATGYYTITEYTKPNWSVELYINDVLVDYTKADASGLYVFKVPIVYGYTTLKLKFYGTMSEERTEERTMNTPYTITPAKEFDYSLSGGVVQDSTLSRFGKGEFNYGVNRFITIGGGLEYLTSITNSPFIPYAKITIQPFSKLLINAEYSHGVKARGLLNYYLGKNTILEIDYTKYAEGQQATLFNAPEERKVKLSLPFRLKKLNGFARLNYTQLVYKTSNINQGTVMLSAYYKQLSANSSTQLYWNDQNPASVISDLALSYRLKKGYQIRSSAQYNANENKLVTINAAIEKSIPKGNFSISYVRNILNNDNLISLNFKYDLSFARTNIYASHSNGNISTSESAQGSLAFGGGNNYIHASNNSSVGKGGISLYPFLDLNNNGVFDKGEPMVKLTSVRVSGGKAIFSKKDSIVRIPDLNAFINYNVEFLDTDLDNISWRFKKKLYEVLIDPNQFKRIDIPIIAVGEVSGMTYMKTDSRMEGIGRILVKFYKKNSTKVFAETLSESDGYLYYLGLVPGNYVAYIDPEQLKNLGMVASPEQISFKISRSFDGDIISGIDFILSPDKKQEPDTANNVLQIETVRAASELQNVTENKTSGMIKSKPYTMVIQVGAFIWLNNAIRAEKKLLKNTDHPINVIFEDGYYKVQISEFKGLIQALGFLPKLFNLGFSEAYVVRVKRP
jgi:hypothetical protein